MSAQFAVRIASTDGFDASSRRAVAGILDRSGAVTGDRCLSEDPPVWEWSVRTSPMSAAELRAKVCAGVPGVDVCVLPLPSASGRRLVVMDVDSTLIRQEVIELLAERAGAREQVAALTESAMRGEADFAESLRARVSTLTDLPVEALSQVQESLELTPGARTLVTVLHAHGHRVGVVSGGFEEVLVPLVERLGIDHVRANRLTTRDGRLTGQVDGRIVDREVKAESLRTWRDRDDIPPEDVVAIGDGANDLAMIAEAGLGVAFCAKPILRERADTTVSFPRLDVVLHYLGFTDLEVQQTLAGTGVCRGE